MCIGTASITRSKTATAEAIFWPAIAASAISARTTSLGQRSKGRPGNVALPVLKPECRANFSHCALRLRRVVRGSLQAEFGGHRLKETDCALSLWSVANVAQSQKSDGTGCNSRN